MQRFSALFHRRSRDGKNDAEVHDPSPSFAEDSVQSTYPKLHRSPGLRGLRNPEDVDPSLSILNKAVDHFVGTDSSVSNPSSTVQSISKQRSPLPSPPRSPVLSSQAPSLWPLPSPRQFPRKVEDTERRPTGFPVTHSDNGNASWIEGETENYSRHSAPVGLPVSSHVRPGGKAHGSSSVGVPAYPIIEQFDLNNSSDSFSSAIQISKDSRAPKQTWPKISDQGYGDTVSTDEYSTAEYNHIPKYQFQSELVSRNFGHPPRDSQAIGSPKGDSPPLSPSSRALSPGGWIKGHLLGTGAFGRVYKGIHSGTGEFCAIKEVEFIQSDHRSREAASQLKKEIASLSTLQHPNIVQYKGSELVGDHLQIYLELIPGGSLFKLYREFKKLEEPVVRRYTRQILLGLAYLHKRKFVHRDIKCANILVDQDGTIKLADFGVSKYIKEAGVPFSLKGSPHWMAPEVIMSTNTGHEYAVDIWSLGCTMLEMFMGRPPWSDLEAGAVMFKITKVGAPPIPESLSEEGKSFVRLCLKKYPADRPTAAALLEHPYVNIQSSVYHSVANNNALEYGEAHLASSLSSAVIYPSLSAPSSPRSSYRPANDLPFSQQSPRLHQRGDPHITDAEWTNHMFDSVSKERRFRKPKEGAPPTRRKRYHEYSQANDCPSLSAPASPKSSLSRGTLPGYPASFYENRRS